ncbi:MAG: amidohydrolase family protein [Acidobacteriota bacterium]|nr:amidohydrolase family protein [Acidobacteriota bacterium]
MTRLRALGVLLLALSTISTGGPADAQEPFTALVGATVHPVSGPPLDGATVLVSGDTIQAVGSDLEVPADASVVDLTGRHLYPTFIAAHSVLGLVEVNSVRGTVDTRETGDLNPALRTEVAFNADSRLLPVTVSGGVLFAHVVPSGGLLAGTSAVMRLEGWNWRGMTVRAPVAMHLQFPIYEAPEESWWGEPKTQEEVDEDRKEALELLNKTFDDARAYRKARAAHDDGRGPWVAYDPNLEALLPVLDGSRPLFLHAAEHRQIEGALEWAREEGLENLVLVSRQDATAFAQRLAEDEIPVILAGVLREPERDWEPYDAAFTAAARLHEAGVKLVIADSGSTFGAANTRNLPFHAAMAATFGLPRDAALRAITLSAAEVLGVAERLGSLEAGKEASFVITDGDPLEITTRIEAVWSAGRPVDLDQDPQRRLYQRYRQRPTAPSQP